MAKFLLVGADPAKAASLHPGGVVTLSAGLLDYARRHDHDVEIINTARSGFDREPFLHVLGNGLKRLGELIGHLRRERLAGVFIFAGAGFSFYERVLMSLICRFFGVRDAFVIVDGRFFEVRQAGWFSRMIIRLLLRIPHRLAATGRKWDELFAELGVPAHRRIRVYYWLAADFPMATEPKQAPQKRPVHMLFVGWMTEAKGVSELLAAIGELSHGYDFSFTFVGGGTLLETTRATIAASGWQGRVFAPGWVSAHDLHVLLKEADVFVLPSHAEGFPMSLIEAFSSAMPAIVSDVGGVSDSLRDAVNGYLTIPGSVQSIVAAMRHYLEQPDLIPQHSRAALAAAHENHYPDTNCGILFGAVA
jgi:glycosyltransferase involved in cell wall biosynthesis